MLNFLHIPKCGGSTVRDYIRMRFRAVQKQRPDAMSIFVYGEKQRLGTHNTNRLSDLDPAVLRWPVLGIVGHYDWASFSALVGAIGTYGNTFTVVRDPVDQRVSDINHMRLLPGHRGHAFSMRLTRANLFDYLVESGHRIQGSYQCNLLGAGLAAGEALDDAGIRQRILSKLCVYKLENTHQALLNHVLYAADDFALETKNITQARAEAQTPDAAVEVLDLQHLSPAQRGALRDAYANDMRLYELAR